MVKHVVALALCLASHAGIATAQLSRSWQIGTEVMYSPEASAPNVFFGGQAPGIRQSALAIRASTDLLRLGPVRLRYSAQLLPVIRLTNVERYSIIESDESRLYVLTGRTNSYGIGIVPVGLDISVPLGSRVRFQVGAGAGITRFTQHVPVAGSRQRNFTAEGDATFMIRTGSERWLQLGMRWKHISNGLTAYENPGFDNRLLFAGMSWRVRAPL